MADMANSVAVAALLSKLANYEESTVLTDFTIICGNQRWQVHRPVLSLHSRRLELAMTGPFRVRDTLEISLTFAE